MDIDNRAVKGDRGGVLEEVNGGNKGTYIILSTIKIKRKWRVNPIIMKSYCLSMLTSQTFQY